MKKIFLLLIFAFQSFFLFSAPMPKWVLDVDSEYPKETYLARLGSGPSIEAAQSNALAQLAGYFSSEVVVNTTSTNNMTNKDEHVTKEQNINQEVNVISEKNLTAVEYSKTYYNRKEKKYYIVAYLNREIAWQNLEDKLQALLERFENFQNICETSEDLMLRYKYAKKAKVAGQEFLNEIYNGFLINPAKRKDYKSKISEINLKIDKDSTVTVPVFLKTTGDYENMITNCVTSEFKNAGFAVTTDFSENLKYQLSINIKNNEKIEEDIHSIFPELEICLSDISQTADYYSFQKKWGRTAAFSLHQAQKKAYAKIITELKDALCEDINKNFTEN